MEGVYYRNGKGGNRSDGKWEKFHNRQDSGTNWSNHPVGSLANEAQVRHQYKGYQEVEGAPENRWFHGEINYNQTHAPVDSWNSI